MPLSACRECSAPVSTDARACPKCGLPNPTQSEAGATAGKVFRGVLLIAAVIVFLLWAMVSGWFG